MPAISDEKPTLHQCDLILITSTRSCLQIRSRSKVLRIQTSIYFLMGNTIQGTTGCKLCTYIFVIETGKFNFNTNPRIIYTPSYKKQKMETLGGFLQAKGEKKRIRQKGINIKQRVMSTWCCCHFQTHPRTQSAGASSPSGHACFKFIINSRRLMHTQEMN